MSDLAVLDQVSALADPIRARLLFALEQQELTVGELTSVLQLPQSTISRHLKVLGNQGWVEKRSEGTRHFYRIEHDRLALTERRIWLLIRDALAATPTTEHDLARLAGVVHERSSRSAQFFSQTATRWDELRSELYGTKFDLFGLLGLLDPDWAVGDLGCGTGQLSEAIAPFVREVVAIDSSAAMLDAARSRLSNHDNVAVRHGKLEQLPLGDQELDLALLFLVLHHLADPAAVIREACRALKPSGALLILDMLPHQREELRHQMGHVWLGFEVDDVLDRLRRAHFEAVSLRQLPTDPSAKGPRLFVARGRAPRAVERVHGSMSASP